jgi:NitT/TauT family transport system substrate-binding protein
VSPWRQQQVRLAIIDWPAYEYFYLASRKGLDRELGFTLHVDQFGSLQDQRRAFSRGDVEAIATTLPEAIAICRDAPARCPWIVLVLDESNGADQVIGAARLQSPAQLKGQRVGLERSVLGEFVLLRAMQSQGLSLADLSLRFDSPKALVSQLQRGAVAAIVTYAPHSDELIGDPRWRVLFSSSQIPGEVVDVLAVSPDLHRRDPQLVAALVRTWWEARAYAMEHPQQSAQLMAQRQGVSSEQFLRSQRLIRYPGQDQQAALLASDGPLQRTMRLLEQQMRQANRLPDGVPLPRLASELVP